MNWAVFLDRDGTLNVEVGLVARPEQLKLIPGAREALQKLKDAGAKLIVTTNQPVVARGLIDEEALGGVHDRLRELLGVELDAVYYCPHHPEKGHRGADNPKYRRDCDCRKPAPGMLKRAAQEHGVDLASSFIIGDTFRDVGAGKAAGCRTVLVRTGMPSEEVEKDADAVCDDIGAAADWILENRA